MSTVLPVYVGYLLHFLFMSKNVNMNKLRKFVHFIKYCGIFSQELNVRLMVF